MGNELVAVDQNGRQVVVHLPPNTDIAKVLQTVQDVSCQLVQTLVDRGVPARLHERITIYEEW